jgi:predicted porin
MAPAKSDSKQLKRTLNAPRVACVLGTVFSLAAVGAHAQSSNSANTSKPASASTSSGLTWNGITLYGIIDVGLQYDTHAAPFSDYFQGGSSDIVQKNSRSSLFGVTSNNLGQSRLGLQGNESLGFQDISAVFKLETFFNPATGNISDALKSLTQNNGRALHDQNTNLDSSIAGEMFEQMFAGISSPTYGTLTFGRINTLLADGIAKYDPNATSYAFSLIGLSGTAAGGGDTQDRRFDDSVKYTAKFANIIHTGLQYRFSDGANRGNSAFEWTLGAEYAGASVDFYFTKVNSAIAASALSAAQVATLPTLGLSPSNSLAATVSDNTTYGLMGMYALGPMKFFAGYENIKFANPDVPLPVGFDDIGGYKLAVVNNDAFKQEKILQVYWAGVKYSVIPQLDVTVAYYGYHQSSFGTGATAGCTTNVSGSCSGELIDLSIDAVYHMSKRWDSYAGVMYTDVQDGLANGYTYARNNMNPSIGLRFSF